MLLIPVSHLQTSNLTLDVLVMIGIVLVICLTQLDKHGASLSPPGTCPDAVSVTRNRSSYSVEDCADRI